MGRQAMADEPRARPWKCDSPRCTKAFSRKSDLDRHTRIHTNERPHQCVTCGKKFIQKSALTVHIRVHTGEKPHECEHDGCHKRFSDSSSLARHRRTHSNQRPYKCPHPFCGRSFCRKGSMVKHRRQAHREGGPLPEDADDASVSDISDSPSTPQPSNMSWKPPVSSSGHYGLQSHGYQEAPSFPDIQRGGTFAALSHQINGQHQYHDNTHGYYNQHIQPQQQHGSHVVSSTGMPQYPHFVTEQSNPAVATMNTNPPTFQHIHGQQQAPSLSVRIPYSGVGMPTSIQSSPSTFSAHSGQSPPPPDSMYELAVNQPAPYSMHSISPAVAPSNVGHGHQHIHHTPEPLQPQTIQHDPKQYQHSQASHPEAPWLQKVPIQFMAMGDYANLGPAALSFMDLKDDAPAGMQMPSERVHELFL